MKFELIHGDCITQMKAFKKGQFDLCLTDPPYNAKNIGKQKKVYKDSVMQLPTKQYQKFCKEWFAQAKRISKTLVFTPGIANICYYPQPDWVICWSKPSAVSFNRMGGFNVWEPIFVYGKCAKGKRLNRDLIMNDIMNFNKGIETQHPCPKQIGLIKKLCDIFSNKGDKIIDPFMGSGTTGVAALDQYKEFTGIEKVKPYFDLTVRRIAEFQAQGKLIEV